MNKWKPDFKKGYWLILVIGASALLYIRFDRLNANPINGFDKALLIIWAILLLIPIAKEVSFFGMSIKSDLERTKNELSEKINEIKFSILTNNSSASNSQNIFNFSNKMAEKRRESKAYKEAIEEENESPGSSGSKTSAKEYVNKVKETILTEKHAIAYLRANGFPEIKENESVATRNFLFEFDGYIPPGESNHNIAQIFEVCQYNGKNIGRLIDRKTKKLIDFVASFETETKILAQGILVIIVKEEAQRQEAKKYIDENLPITRYISEYLVIEIKQLIQEYDKDEEEGAD